MYSGLYPVCGDGTKTKSVVKVRILVFRCSQIHSSLRTHFRHRLKISVQEEGCSKGRVTFYYKWVYGTRHSRTFVSGTP